MPATGVSGLDLYVKHDGRWRWLAVGFPKEQTSRVALVSGLLPDGEATVDSSHPTDLGFARQADAFKKALMPLLPK